MALNRNTRSSRKEQQGRKLPQIKRSEKKKCKTVDPRDKQYQPTVKILTTVTKAASQLNKINSLKSNELKEKSLSVKASKRLKAKAEPDKLSAFTPATVGAAIEIRKTPRKSSKMHNDQFERRRRSASQCCADCKSVVQKREQLRLRASLGIKLCDSCWDKRNTKTPNKSQKSLITKSCEIKLVDILRTSDSSLNLNAEKQTTSVKRKRQDNAVSEKGCKKLKLRNSVNLEESEIDTDVKTENLNESNDSEEDSLICLQTQSKESSEDGEVNKQAMNSGFQNEVTNTINSDDLKQTSKYNPDDASTVKTDNDKEIDTPEPITKKLPGKMKAKAEPLMLASGQDTTKRTSRRNSNLSKTANEDDAKVVKSNLRKTRFKRENTKQLLGKISKNISNVALRLKTGTVSNKNAGKSVKVPFKKKVVSKRLSDQEIIETLNSVEICVQQNHKSTLKGNKLREVVSLPKKSPIKRLAKSSQSYAVTKVKQRASNRERKSIGKEKHSPSKLFFCEVCNKDFSSLSESKLHEISHDCRYPVLILHRCDSAQGVLSLIREVDFPSYDPEPPLSLEKGEMIKSYDPDPPVSLEKGEIIKSYDPDPPVSLEKGEIIKSDEFKEQNPAESHHSDSSPDECSLNKETKDSHKVVVKQKVVSDTSKEPTEGKQDELVVMLEEMFGSSNDDSTSSNQVKDVDSSVKGIIDSSALVEVLDGSFKNERMSDRSESSSINTRKETNRKLNFEGTKADEILSTSEKHVPTVNNVSNTGNDAICNAAGDTNSLNVLNETGETKINDKNDVSAKVEGNQVTINNKIETTQNQDRLSGGSPESISDSISHESNLLQDPVVDKNSEEPVKGHRDVHDSTDESHNGEKLSDLKGGDKTTLPDTLEKLPIEDVIPPNPVTSEKDEVINETALHDNQSQDDGESNAGEGEKLDEHLSEIKHSSKDVPKEDLDEKDTESEKMATDGGRDVNMETEEISDDAVKENDEAGLNDLKSSESTMQDSPVAVSGELNEICNEDVLQIQSETVDTDEKNIAENSENVDVSMKVISQQLNDDKESADEVISPSDSSPPQMKSADNEMQKDVSYEMEQSEILSDDKIVTANEIESEATISLSVVKEIKPVSNETEEKETGLMKLVEGASSKKETHNTGNTIDGSVQLSEGTQKSAEMSEDSESSSFKFDAIDEPGILENSSRSSNGEILSELMKTCGSGSRATDSVPAMKNVPAAESVTESNSEVQDESKCDDIDILIKEVLESNSLESDKSNNDDVIESLADGGVSNNNNNGCVENNTSGNLVSDEPNLPCDKSSSIKSDTQKGETIPLDDELNLEPVSDDEMDFI